jgi:hypothetical protein
MREQIQCAFTPRLVDSILNPSVLTRKMPASVTVRIQRRGAMPDCLGVIPVIRVPVTR